MPPEHELVRGWLVKAQRDLAAVFGTPGATTDGLHLSASARQAIGELTRWVRSW